MAELPELLAHCTGFEWDRGNSGKNLALHQVTDAEAEQVFFKRPVLVAPDAKHSQAEARLAVLGVSEAGRALALVVTVRNGLIRVISARDMSRKERKLYGEAR